MYFPARPEEGTGEVDLADHPRGREAEGRGDWPGSVSYDHLFLTPSNHVQATRLRRLGSARASDLLAVSYGESSWM